TVFRLLNRGKESVSLDPKSAKGLQALRRLIDHSDVLIENFRPGALDALGLGYETLRETNPGLVYCQITGFGRSGPKALWPGLDLIAQAASGIMSITGEESGRPPVRCGVPIADFSAGLLATVGVLAALEYRRKTGVGQRVDTSIFESSVFQTLW